MADKKGAFKDGLQLQELAVVVMGKTPDSEMHLFRQVWLNLTVLMATSPHEKNLRLMALFVIYVALLTVKVIESC